MIFASEAQLKTFTEGINKNSGKFFEYISIKNFSSENFSDSIQKALKTFQSFPSLNELNLSSTNITGEEFKGLKFKKLNEIHLSNCKDLTVDDLKAILKSAPNIKEIDLDGCIKLPENYKESSISVKELKNLLKDEPTFQLQNSSVEENKKDKRTQR